MISGIELPGRLEQIVNSLFPSVFHLPLAQVSTTGGVVPFSLSEIVVAARCLPNRKTPGLDAIGNELLKVAVSSDLSIP